MKHSNAIAAEFVLNDAPTGLKFPDWSGMKPHRVRMSPAEAFRWNEEMIRSEEHTFELQSRPYLVCRLLLEKKKSSTDTRSASGGQAHTVMSVCERTSL